MQKADWTSASKAGLFGIAGVAVSVMVSAGTTQAATYQWVGGTAELWTTNNNWNPNTAAPGASDSILQTSVPGTANRNIDPNGNRTITDLQWSPTSDITMNIRPNLGAGAVHTLAITGTLTKDTAGTLVIRGGNGKALNLTIGQINLSAGTLQFGGNGQSSDLNVTSTTISAGATLALQCLLTDTFHLGAVSFNGAEGDVDTLYLNALDAVERTIEAASLSGATTTSLIAGANTTSAARPAVLRLTGVSGETTYAGRIRNGLNATVDANPSSRVKLEKTGGSTQILTGDLNTYGGGTTISGGKLLVANAGASSSATGTGAVSVTGSGATLGGTGSVRGAAALVTATGGGRIAPGMNTSGVNTNFGAISSLNLGVGGGGLTLTNAHLDFDLADLATGASDRIVTSGLLTLGTVSLNVNQIQGSLELNQAYTLISGAASSSGFSASNFTATGLGSYSAVFLMSGNDLTVTFVPEPSSVALLGLGGSLLLARRRATASN